MRKEYNINGQIKSQKINLILSDGIIKEGILLSQAMALAAEEEMDVVEVSDKGKGGLPVCKILDYGKLMYKEDKKKKNQKKINHIKEIKYSLNIDAHDLEVKHKKIFKFLAKHYIVRYILELKGREKYKIEDAFHKINTNLKEFDSMATWKEPKISQGTNRASISTVLNPILMLKSENKLL